MKYTIKVSLFCTEDAVLQRNGRTAKPFRVLSSMPNLDVENRRRLFFFNLSQIEGPL